MNLVVDGNSLFAKWFFGFPGEDRNAYFGFYNGLSKLVREYKPSKLHIAFDSRESWRKLAHPVYKSKRTPLPDGYYEQLTALKLALSLANFSIYEVAGFESDDLVAGIAPLVKPCVVYSDDKDILQLIGEDIWVRRANVLWDINTFNGVYGFSPDRLPFFQALMGDTVDCYPGVGGIGQKRARLLVQEYETLDKLYENPPIGIMGTRLLLDAGNAYMSLMLATLKAPEFELKPGSYSMERLREVLNA